MTPTCKSCRFWTGDRKTVLGFAALCRRFPPQTKTNPGDWCGEFVDQSEAFRAARKAVGL